MEEDQTPQQPSPTPALRVAAHVLYLPLLAALGCAVVLFLLLLARGNPAGARALLYGAALFFLGRRYARIWRGELDGPRLWIDVAVLAVIDLLLLVLWLDLFS